MKGSEFSQIYNLLLKLISLDVIIPKLKTYQNNNSYCHVEATQLNTRIMGCTVTNVWVSKIQKSGFRLTSTS